MNKDSSDALQTVDFPALRSQALRDLILEDTYATLRVVASTTDHLDDVVLRRMVSHLHTISNSRKLIIQDGKSLVKKETMQVQHVVLIIVKLSEYLQRSLSLRLLMPFLHLDEFHVVFDHLPMVTLSL
jgi:hypothetical protein